MREYCMREITDAQVEAQLNARYPVYEEGKRWQTPFGISFAAPNYTSEGIRVDWYCLYDTETPTAIINERMMELGRRKAFWIEKGEVLHLIKQLDKREQGFSVFAKPDAVVQLEQIFNVEAKLHYLFTLIWHIKVPGHVSCINNPFDLARAYCGGPDNFEVMYEGEEDVCEYVPLYTLLTELGKRQALPTSKYCAACGRVVPKGLASKCGRCKMAHYCNKQCQTVDWQARHKGICKSIQ